MIARIGPITQVQDTGTVSGADAYRTPYVPSVDTNGLTVQAASLDLLPVVATAVAPTIYLSAAAPVMMAAQSASEARASGWACSSSPSSWRWGTYGSL